MSPTAQKQDISDPAVVAAFAAKVRTERRLAALYLLTVADIRGTSPRVWNAWKAKLLEDLFHATLSRARPAATRPARSTTASKRAAAEAQRLLRLYAVPEGAEQALWQKLDSVYFQRHTADEIAWHARQLYLRVDGEEPVVRARLSRAGVGLQVMVYMPDQKELFARICGFFGKARLSILDAKIHTTRHGYALDTFTVHDPVNAHASIATRSSYVEFELKRVLCEQRAAGAAADRPRQPAPQAFPADARGAAVSRRQGHALHPRDRRRRPARACSPGSRITLAKANVNVASAKINTLGERAEDVFLLDGARLHDEAALLRLETALYEQLRLYARRADGALTRRRAPRPGTGRR